MALTKVSGSIIKDPLNLGEVSIGGTLTYQDVTNVDSLGIGTFRAGINVSGGQLDVGSNIKIGNAGVITATTFVGALTGTASGNPTLSSGANNRVVTATGANALSGESNLTFDGTNFSVTGAANVAGTLILQPGGTAWSTTNTRPQLGRQADGELRLGAGSDSSSIVTLYTSPSAGGTLAERLRIASDGQVSISSDGTTDGLLTIKGDSDQVGTPSIRLLDGSDTREVSISNTSGDFVASVHGNDNAIHGHIKMFESGIIDFNNGGASGSNSNRLRIDTAGVARFINPTGELKIASSTNNDAGKIIFQENTTVAWSLEAQRANGYFRILDEYNGNSGSPQERFRIEPADNGNTTIEDNNLVIKKTSLAGNGIGGITIGKDVSGTDGCIQINSVNTGSDTDQIGIDFKTHKSTAGSAVPQETLRITHSGRLLQREYPYTDSYQASNWGGAYYLKGGWMRFSSNFSNPTKDLVILPDGGNTNSGMFIKVTVCQIDYPGNDRGLGAIHIGYASAKRTGDGSGKWYVQNGNMAMESGSNFHGNFSNVGTLNWQNGNTSDTNTLRYIANRVTNYDRYDVQVEVWQNGNCAYYLHSDFLTQ
nr:phage tail fiber-like protein [uncultured Mediterranean phage uvMED]